jgi:hypothetical protein
MTITTDDKPPTEQAGRIAELERQLAQARAETVAAVKKHEDFVAHASEVLGSAADERDLCEVYDEVAEQAGLLPRVRRQEVDIEVTYRQTITVSDRTWEQAIEQVRELSVSRYFAPGLPFQGDNGVANNGVPYSLSVSVIEE